MNWLKNFTPGQVRSVFSSDVHSPLVQLHSAIESLPAGARLITGMLKTALPLTEMLDRLVWIMAEAALSVWPNWYGQESPFDADLERPWQQVIDCFASRQLSQEVLEVQQSWVRAASRYCRTGTIPNLPEFSPTIQLRQLALTLAAQPLIVALSIEDADPKTECLTALARALEWFAREATASVVVVLSDRLTGRSELDNITSHTQVSATQSIPTIQIDRQAEEKKLTVCPIIGRPHPGSPGEQILAKRLERDPLLGPLFRCNQRVPTVFNSQYLVDLLWAEGKVVVEIDGYGYHSAPAAFINDRYRDYQLTLTGYLVLRLPHDFVVQDVELALERIREFVRYRQDKQLHDGEQR